MVAGVGQMYLEAFKHDTAAKRQRSTMRTLTIIATAYLHLAGTQAVVAGCQIELLAQEEIGSKHKVLANAVLPVVQPDERGRES